MILFESVKFNFDLISKNKTANIDEIIRLSFLYLCIYLIKKTLQKKKSFFFTLK